MNQLSEILDRGVPDPPPLDGLAGRAERQARRTRGRRRAGLAGGVAVAVAAALVVPALVGGPSREVPAPPGPAAPVVRDCGPAEPADEFELTRGVAFLRFCFAGGGGPRALVPSVALTTDLAATMTQINEGMSFSGYCVGAASASEVQVGYRDGTTVAYNTAEDYCGVAQRVLMRAIARQESAGLPDLDLPALTCPPLMPRGGGPSVRGSDLADSPLTSLPADTALRCTYDDPFASTLVRDVRDPEALRLAVLGAGFVPGPTECAPDAGATDRLERLLLRLVDGSVHVVQIDHCGQTTIGRTYLGLAPPGLLDILDRLAAGRPRS